MIRKVQKRVALLGAPISFSRVKSIEPWGTADVYNLEVEALHNFLANDGIVVHNCIDALCYGCSPIWNRAGQTEKNKVYAGLYVR